MNRKTVMIVDDHEVVRLGLKGLIAHRKDEFDVIGEAATVKEAVTRARELKPDVIIMDVRLADGSGIDACREICRSDPDTKVIILTSFPDNDIAIESILAGASGFVLKEIKGNALMEAIDKVTRGESILDSRVTGNVLKYIKSGDRREKLEDVLTPQELRVLAMVAEGKTNREIGNALFLSERTVRNHLSRVLQKLNLQNRAAAAAYYVTRKK
ncbi:MAG: response regulator transcription factor [Bacillota bacterium]